MLIPLEPKLAAKIQELEKLASKQNTRTVNPKWCEHGLKSDDDLHTKVSVEKNTDAAMNTLDEKEKCNSSNASVVIGMESQDRYAVHKPLIDSECPGSSGNCSSVYDEKHNSFSLGVSSPSKQSCVQSVINQHSPCTLRTSLNDTQHAILPGDKVDANMKEADTGPVFPSFKRQIPETAPSYLRNIVDMYNQVNQHFNLDSTDFLSEITDKRVSENDSTHPPFDTSSSVVEDENVYRDSSKSLEQMSRHCTADSEPLCLVIHKRYSGDCCKDKRNRDNEDKSTKSSSQRIIKTHRSKEEERGKKASRNCVTTKETGDKKLQQNYVRTMRKRGIAQSTSVPSLQKKLPAKRTRRLEDDFTKEKGVSDLCNQKLVINIDENNMLSLQAKENSFTDDKVRQDRKDENVSFYELAEILNEPRLEIDYAVEEDDTQLESEFYDANDKIPSATLKCTPDIYSINNNIPKCKMGTIPSMRFLEYSNQPTSIAKESDQSNGEITKSSEENVQINTRLASLRDRERTGSYSLPPKKRNFRKSNRAAKQSLSCSNFCKEKFKKFEEKHSNMDIKIQQQQQQQQQHTTQQQQQQQQAQDRANQAQQAQIGGQQQQKCQHSGQQQQQVQYGAQWERSVVQQQQQQQKHAKPGLLQNQGQKDFGYFETNVKKRFQCPYEACRSAFTRKWSMDCHIRKIHKGKFPCEHAGCELDYDTKTDLRHHMNVDHNGKCRKWKCNWPGCDKTFFTHYHQRIHALTHTGEKPVACDECDYRCRQPTALQWHKKKHQDEQFQGENLDSSKSST